jgi:hypothetical protein
MARPEREKAIEELGTSDVLVLPSGTDPPARRSDGIDRDRAHQHP